MCLESEKCACLVVVPVSFAGLLTSWLCGRGVGCGSSTVAPLVGRFFFGRRDSRSHSASREEDPTPRHAFARHSSVRCWLISLVRSFVASSRAPRSTRDQVSSGRGRKSRVADDQKWESSAGGEGHGPPDGRRRTCIHSGTGTGRPPATHGSSAASGGVVVPASDSRTHPSEGADGRVHQPAD